MQTKNHYSSSHCSHCKLVRYSSQLFTKILQHEDCQQFDSTIADTPLHHFSLHSACCCCVQCNFLVLIPLFSFTGLPSPPHTPSYTVQQYNQDNVMLRVQWQSPQDGGRAPVNYTITVSPGSTQVTTTATNTSLSAIPYNVNHTISIVATNCNGSSSAVMETIRIGKLYSLLWMYIV